MENKTCPFCGSRVGEDAPFCPECGAQFVKGRPQQGGFPMPPAPPPPPGSVRPTDSGMKCPHCGGIVNGLAEICTNCGARLSRI